MKKKHNYDKQFAYPQTLTKSFLFSVEGRGKMEEGGWKREREKGEGGGDGVIESHIRRHFPSFASWWHFYFKQKEKKNFCSKIWIAGPIPGFCLCVCVCMCVFVSQSVHIHCRYTILAHLFHSPFSLSLSLSLLFCLPPSLTHKPPHLSLSLIPSS